MTSDFDKDHYRGDRNTPSHKNSKEYGDVVSCVTPTGAGKQNSSAGISWQTAMVGQAS